jgi:protein-S-isoprenylcysteine O-methyltransferase Ste14
MELLFIFGLLSIPLIIISRKSVFKPGSHGFYRFFAWEGILLLFVSNYRYWFDDPFSFRQIVSWIFLFISLYPAIAGVILLKKHGNSRNTREDQSLLAFEKTTLLVETGIYKYVRHPMYSSLLFLTLGIFLKHISAGSFIVTVWSSVFLLGTAFMDEKECIAYFGEVYKDYMKRTKRFIPFLF